MDGWGDQTLGQEDQTGDGKKTRQKLAIRWAQCSN
jgi:hypothetical protein